MYLLYDSSCGQNCKPHTTWKKLEFPWKDKGKNSQLFYRIILTIIFNFTSHSSLKHCCFHLKVLILFCFLSGQYYTPVVCFLLFNTMDYIGRVLSGIVQFVSRIHLYSLLYTCDNVSTACSKHMCKFQGCEISTFFLSFETSKMCLFLHFQSICGVLTPVFHCFPTFFWLSFDERPLSHPWDLSFENRDILVKTLKHCYKYIQVVGNFVNNNVSGQYNCINNNLRVRYFLSKKMYSTLLSFVIFKFY